MSLSLIAFSPQNRRMIAILLACHLIWAVAVVGFWALGGLFDGPDRLWTVLFTFVQLYAAAQLILPALLLHPEERSRGFYLFWGLLLSLLIWGSHQLTVAPAWQPLFSALKSALLLLVATIIGAALARYVRRLWELVPVCIIMTMADFASFLGGPTAGFVTELQEYYTTFEGPPPLVDMILVKVAMPATPFLSPVFGVSDWIMVVFFAIVARHFGVNDNLVGARGDVLAQKGRLVGYLPVSLVALLAALGLSQMTGMFVPALPVIALVMLGWYAVRYSLGRRAPDC